MTMTMTWPGHVLDSTSAPSSAPASSSASVPVSLFAPTPHYKESGVNEGRQLDIERKQATFQTEQMTNLLYGGAEAVASRREINSRIEAMPVFQKQANYWLSRSERVKVNQHKLIAKIELLKQSNVTTMEEEMKYQRAIDELLPTSVHMDMFIPTIESQGTEEQKHKWLVPAKNYAIIGTYAQTELGHGSFVRGLETTATYDPNTQTFDLHSPTLTATKWWPGNLGKTCNIALVMARLISKGTDHGVHTFIVPLRSYENHMPLPGIELFDIGDKFGFNTVDNGGLRMNHVKIPRENMLMRYSRVEPDGTYVAPPNMTIAYGTMVYIRSWIVILSASTMARALTIAIRYSAVRRQFPSTEDPSLESQVLNYQTQQYTLFPLLATSYAFHFVGAFMKNLYTENQNNLNSGNLSLMAELHIASSGLKALCSDVNAACIEACRRCCGGHGYLMTSGLIHLYADQIAVCTVEGENMVMYLQTARGLLKQFGSLTRQKKPTTGILSYLNEPNSSGRTCPVQSPADWLKPQVQLQAYSYRTERLLVSVSNRMNKGMQQGASWDQMWEQCKVELVQCAKAHTYHIVLHHFIAALSRQTDPQLKAVLTTLCNLFALSTLEPVCGDLIGYMNVQQLEWLHSTVRELLVAIRPNAVALVDAWDLSDHLLNSALGRYNGNVYETLYEWAKLNPINHSELGPGIAEELLPFLRANQQTLQAKL